MSFIQYLFMMKSIKYRPINFAIFTINNWIGIFLIIGLFYIAKNILMEEEENYFDIITNEQNFYEKRYQYYY